MFGYADLEKNLLILSCGGGGTVYMSKCLQVGGLDIGHEHIYADGAIGWPFVQGFCDHNGNPMPGAEFKHVFHQVRNPLSVITTWMKNKDMNAGYWQFIRRSVPEIRITDTPIVQCAKYWYYWNKKAESMSEWTYRVEAFKDLIDEFELRLGVSLDRQAILSIPKNTGAWGGKSYPVSWGLLKRSLPVQLYQDIQEMAQRYGYATVD